MHLVWFLWQYIFTATVAGAVLHLAWVIFPEPRRHQTPAHGGQHALIHRGILPTIGREKNDTKLDDKYSLHIVCCEQRPLPYQNVSVTAGRDSGTVDSCCKRVCIYPHLHPSIGAVFAAPFGFCINMLGSLRQGQECMQSFHTFSPPDLVVNSLWLRKKFDCTWRCSA